MACGPLGLADDVVYLCALCYVPCPSAYLAQVMIAG